MRVKIFRLITLILLILTFIQIFNFSAQDGTESSGVSKKVALKIINVLHTTRNLSEEEKDALAEKSQKVVRKCAHLSIYTLVGILIMSFISTYKIKTKYRILVSLLVGFLYAASDEIHQTFIPGRTGSPIDVGIDTCGTFLGILIVIIIMLIYKSINSRKSNLKA